MFNFKFMFGFLLVGLLLFAGCGGGCKGHDDCTDPLFPVCEFVSGDCVAGNSAPIVSISSPGVNADFDEGVSVSFEGSATDVDGDSLTVSWNVSPSVGVVISDSTAQVTSAVFNVPGSYDVSFSASDGEDSDSQSVFITINPKSGESQVFKSGVWVQAEDGVLVSPIQKSADGNLIFTPIGTSIDYAGSASYTFDVEEAGKYKLNTVVNAPDSGSNSFFVGLDSENAQGDINKIWDVVVAGDFGGDYVNWRGVADPKEWDLSVGEHTFIFWGREPFTKLDKLMLTKVQAFCEVGPWQNDACGTGACLRTQMHQIRTVTPKGCANSEICVNNSVCEISNPPNSTINVPVNNSSFDVGQTVSFSGLISDSDSELVNIKWYIDRMGDGIASALLKEEDIAPGSSSGTVTMSGTITNTVGQEISLEDEGATYDLTLVANDGENEQLQTVSFTLVQTADSTAIQNKKWERSLLSSKNYNNPYKDVKTKVTFEKGTQSFETYAFWDGDNNFKIRAAFPSTGTWSWSTSSSDASNKGLHNQKGTVFVEPYSGSNVLYKKGFLKISSNKRYLTYGDNTPFLWVGDTAWVAPLKASYEDWKTYVDDRISKNFNVIMISPASDWGDDSDPLDDVYGNEPFFSDDKWNPLFWHEYDRKIQYANDKGVVVVVVGLMEPVYRYPSTENAKLFARNFASRYHGNFVILSPSFDTWNKDYFGHADEVGYEISKATSRNLITQHPGTPYHPQTNTIVDFYFGKSYMDFTGMQTGHNSLDRNWCVWKAINWNIDAYKKTPTTPLINLETLYEGYKQDGVDKPAGSDLDARTLGYLSMLSGAKGYSYGVQGIWNWEANSSKDTYWKSSLSKPGSIGMKYLYNFFDKVRWYDLVPGQEYIKNQPADNSKLMGFAVTSDGRTGVGYLHKTSSIELDMAVFSGSVNAKWFNPRTGAYSNIGVYSNSGKRTFSRPDSNDWVLLLELS